jgi:hypothetical protein
VKSAHLPRLLLVVLGLLCLENLARVGLSIQQTVQLPNLPTALSPVYVALTSALWAMGYLICVVGVIRRAAWAWWVTVAVTIGYQVYLWVTRLAFARSSEVFAVLGFRAILSAAMLVVVLGLVGLWHLRSIGEREQGRSGARDQR